MRAALLFLVPCLLLPAPLRAQSADEVAFVRALLEEMQPRSFAEGRELCGFVGRDATGAWVASGPHKGTIDACPVVWPDDMAEVVASWHTHAGFDRAYLGELPSAADLQSDHRNGTGGWIATPGGRLWYVDGPRLVAKQVCAAGCLPVAPGFTKAADGDVAKGYAYEDLLRRLSE